MHSLEEPPSPSDSYWNAYGRTILAGALGGVVSDLVMHPIDTVRARQQVHRGSNLSFFETGYRVVKNHGAGGLYRGIGATMCLTM